MYIIRMLGTGVNLNALDAQRGLLREYDVLTSRVNWGGNIYFTFGE